LQPVEKMIQVEAMTAIRTETTWTMERIALLKSRIDAGFSCGQIAREMGVSRNAVIGKANRLGLSRLKRATAGNLEQSRNNSRSNLVTPRERLARALKAKPQLALPEAPADSTARCSLLELQQWHCRWPIGDPRCGDFGFCGGKPVDGLPYCLGHARMAYRPGARAATEPHQHVSRRIAECPSLSVVARAGVLEARTDR
jgi:GcrA cell cycle regulator